MNTYLLIAIGALGVGATVQYFLGVKKNKWLGKRIAAQVEDLLHPKESQYVNIGGAIGYNFTYKLREPWKDAKGTITFFPRHSLLYMPLSLVMGGSDRFFINVFTDKKLAGEGHIVEKGHLRRAKIDGIQDMSREEIKAGGKTFILLWKHEAIKKALIKTLEKMPEKGSLAHFCCFADNKTFFLYLKPQMGEITENFQFFVDNCSEYFR
jgi:hypothetical protein